MSLVEYLTPDVLNALISIVFMSRLRKRAEEVGSLGRSRRCRKDRARIASTAMSGMCGRSRSLGWQAD
jgi:hypothetical protein